MDLVSIFYVLIRVIMIVSVVQYVRICIKVRGLPGPVWFWPWIGSVISLVQDPHGFWTRQEAYGPLSWNYIAGWLMINSNRAADVERIFKNQGELKLELHPNARRILGENNLAFLHGKEHKELRQRLLSLFSKKALSIYLSLQEELIIKHIDLWIEKCREEVLVKLRDVIRMLNIETSQTVFVGPYLTSESRKQMEEDYNQINQGFLSLPIYFPGSSLYKACKARERIISTLEQIVKKSRAIISDGQEPQCLLDFLMQVVIQSPDIQHFKTDHDIAYLLLDFLFASQDASTSSLCWICTILEANPNVLELVRDEQKSLRPNNEPITECILRQATYTRNVVRETLRYRPPATMVPHVTVTPFPIGKDPSILIPEGTLVIPNIWGVHKSWDDGEKFIPERFDQVTRRPHEIDFTFGYGPHSCMGREYATNHLMCFLSILSTRCEWAILTKETIEYGPTIHPGDGCLVSFDSRRV